MKKETRLQLLKRRRDKIIYALYYTEGFLLEEIAKVFSRSTTRIWQIIKKVESEKSKK